jgi:DNA-binding transcriptional LysR family regulator
MTIESRHLRYFVAVAEERNFTRAAARLHMAQPPLSAQIRQLEQRLGATLLDRRPGDVSLTPAGEALFEAAYESLAALDDGVAAVQAIAAGRRGRVRLALGPTAPLPPALAALGQLRDHAPGLQVELTRASDADGLVARGRADVAMVLGDARLGVVSTAGWRYR